MKIIERQNLSSSRQHEEELPSNSVFKVNRAALFIVRVLSLVVLGSKGYWSLLGKLWKRLLHWVGSSTK